MFYFNTSKPQPHFIFYRIPVVLETADHLGEGEGGAHPLHPPPRSASADCHCELLFDSFNLLSESDVLKLISSPAKKNCNLDPMPTKLVAGCLDVSASSYLNR